MAKRILVIVSPETQEQIDELAERFSIPRAHMAGMCVSMGLQAIKLALNSDYSPILEDVSKNIDKVLNETQAGRKTLRKVTGQDT
jgi:hypothetical protein